ncbi:MAG TPA: hypothetical protein PK253_12660 [Spirochaetota bacterium]|nr:hypothetical protein [Spirochaetota bacterium]
MKKCINPIRFLLCFPALLLLLLQIQGHTEQSLFSRVIDANKGIRTIDCDISQFIFHNDTVENFSGRYRVNEKGFFRIDYEHPSRQIVLKNQNGLSWYFPQEKLLYIIQEKGPHPVQPGINPLKDILNTPDPRFAMHYTGTHMYGFFTSSHHFAAKDPAKGLVFTIISDAETLTVLEKAITDLSGKEIIREIYSNYRKNGSRYFPGRVDVLARTTRGITRNTTFYRNVHLNRNHPDSIFFIEIPLNTTKKYIDVQ